MDLAYRKIHDVYHHLFYTMRDPRSTNLLFVGYSPLSVTMLLISYVLLVKFGPKVMESRKPFELRNIMIIYNVSQVILNFYLVAMSTYVKFWKYKYDFNCQPVDYTKSEAGLYEVHFTYIYFMLKLYDWMDTVFIILKKKKSQLTFLHCYHHALVFIGTYFALIWAPGGEGSPLGILNSFIHVIMYSYYFMTCIRPEMKKSFWWKRYITQMQLVQFIILTCYYTKTLLAFNCDFPKAFNIFYLSQNLVMLYLFMNFYIKTYLLNKRK